MAGYRMRYTPPPMLANGLVMAADEMILGKTITLTIAATFSVSTSWGTCA